MKTIHIFMLVGYACFGTGMILGEGLEGSIWWLLTFIAVGIGCILFLYLLHRPRKKRLPSRKTRLQVVRSRKVAGTSGRRLENYNR